MTTTLVALQPFDDHASCPKCMWSPINTRHCAVDRFSVGWYSTGPHHQLVPEGDHLHRECGRCGYAWLELPLDRQPWDEERWKLRLEEMRGEIKQDQQREREMWRSLPQPLHIKKPRPWWASLFGSPQ